MCAIPDFGELDAVTMSRIFHLWHCHHSTWWARVPENKWQKCHPQKHWDDLGENKERRRSGGKPSCVISCGVSTEVRSKGAENCLAVKVISPMLCTMGCCLFVHFDKRAMQVNQIQRKQTGNYIVDLHLLCSTPVDEELSKFWCNILFAVHLNSFLIGMQIP